MRWMPLALCAGLALAGCGGEGEPAVSPSPEATATRAPEDGAFVRILSPEPGSAVATPLFIAGDASVPEGRLVVSIRTRAGVVVCAAPTLADAGAPAVGSWSVPVGLRPPPEPGDIVVEAYAAPAPGGDLALMDSVSLRLTTAHPAILVSSPQCGDTVGAAVSIEGTASVFEGTVSLTARDLAGRTLAEGFTTATQGAPGRGSFAATLRLPAGVSGPVLIEAWSANAETGSPEHVFGVPVIVSP